MKKKIVKLETFPVDGTYAITSELLDYILATTVTQANAISVFENLYASVQKLRSIQKNFLKVNRILPAERTDSLQALQERYSNIIDGNFVFKERARAGIGLVVDEKLKVGFEKSAILMEVPQNEMLICRASQFYKEPVFATDPILSNMENVSLSIVLLCELTKLARSHWYHYIQALPRHTWTFLFFDPTVISVLSHSSCLQSVVATYACLCRQYAYFFNKYCTKLSKSLPIWDSFCFDDYAWAVSIVASRNNKVTVELAGQQKEALALIPVWDMINHKFFTDAIQGQLDETRHSLVFFAEESVAPGDEVFMHYGDRTSAQFLMYAGFVPEEDNRHDECHVYLSFSKSDKALVKKSCLLAAVGVAQPLTVSLRYPVEHNSDMAAFTRVFCMQEDQLDEYLLREPGTNEKLMCRELSPNESELDRKAVDFMTKRMALLVKRTESAPLERINDPFLRQSCNNLLNNEKRLINAFLVNFKSKLL